MEHHYTAIIIKSDDWYAGTVKELSGVHTQGKTVEEVKENLKEAIAMVIESNTRHFIAQAEEYIEEDLVVAI